MEKLFERLVNAVVDLISDFTMRKLGGFIFFGMVAVSSIFVYEMYTQNFHYSRVEREISILDRLSSLEPKVLETDNSIIHETFNHLSLQFSKQIINPTSDSEIVKSGVGAVYTLVPWIVICLLVVVFGESDRLQTIIGVAVLSIPFVWVNSKFPIVFTKTVNMWVIPWLEIGIFVFAVMKWDQRKQDDVSRSVSR